MKKFASLIMAVLMLATMLSVFAVPAFAETGTIDGTDLTWELSEDGKTLTFTGKGAMPDYDIATFEGRPWHSAAETVTTVQINPGITALGDYALFYFEKLTNVSIPSSVQSIGEFAFDSCTSLASVTIPSSVKSIGDYAFGSCTSLESVTIPSGVASIGTNAFANCSSLESVMILYGVTGIGDKMFNFCTSLESVTIPSSVTSIGNNAFNNCTSLQSVTIPSSVTSIGNNAFQRCTNLESITIPYGVKSIGDFAFQQCTNLESITIPYGVTSIGQNAFSDCSKLASVTVKASTPPTLGRSVFDRTAGNLAIYVPCGAGNDYKNAKEWTKNQNKIFEAYVVDDQPGENGTIMLDKDCFPTETYTAANETVTVTVMPAAGYLLKADSLSAVAENGAAIALTQDETDPMKYTFTMPCSNVTVTAEFEACEHSESEWVVEAEATCGADGYRVNKCKACGKVLETEVIPATGKHTFDKSNWHYDATYHWHAAVCCDTEEVLDKKEHTYNFFGFGNTCTVCGYVKGGSVTGSALSDGSWWIIGGIAVIAVVGVATLVIVKKKKKPE